MTSILHNLHPDLLRIIYRECSEYQQENGCDGDITVIGYTEMKTMCDDLPCTFHASPNLQGRPWYDWAYVQYDIDSDEDNCSVEGDTSTYFPSMVLGFIQLPGKDKQVVICTSTQPMPWKRLRKDFICPTTLSDNFHSSYVLAPLSSIVHPLLVFKDYGNVNARTYFYSLLV